MMFYDQIKETTSAVATGLQERGVGIRNIRNLWNLFRYFSVVLMSIPLPSFRKDRGKLGENLQALTSKA
jgi:hypothetical protein